MNKSIIIAFALPSLMFYQSNAPILYSSEKLVAQVKEEQNIMMFDLSETGNMIIVSNERVEEQDELSKSNEETEPEQPPDQKASKRKKTTKETGKNNLPKTGKKLTAKSAKKKSTASLETIEQKISALPFTELPDDKSGERELVRMLANMSGTILFGTKMTEESREEYLIF